MSPTVSTHAQHRTEALRAALTDPELVVHDTVVTVVAPGALTPAGGDQFAVFTPYSRRWLAQGGREPLSDPRRLTMPRIGLGDRPTGTSLCPEDTSPDLVPGGETEGRKRMAAWFYDDGGRGIDTYADRHDDLPGDATSRLPPTCTSAVCRPPS